MKKIRIKKVAGSVLLILAMGVSFFGFFPKDCVMASQYSLSYYRPWEKDYITTVESFQPLDGVSTQYFCVYNPTSAYYNAFILSEDSSCTVKMTVIDSGTANYTVELDNSVRVGEHIYYYRNFGLAYPPEDSTTHMKYYNVSSSGGSGTYVTSRTGLSDSDYVKYFVSGSFPDDVVLSDSNDTEKIDAEAAKGTKDNPKNDSDIGTLILSKTVMYEESNGDDVNDLYNLWSWKNKTNTGFSLSDNKYAQTFIQVRVESKCVVYSDLRHTKIKKKFLNYGEKAMLFSSHPASQQPLKISYLKDIPDVLPKTHSESYNPLYVGYNYTLYFRVVCTNDLAVIPSDSSKWYCGGWRAMDCNADIQVGQSDKSENGDFDESDNWVDDEDDGNNDVESGSDSVHDSDEAKDNFANVSNKTDSSVEGATATMKSLLEMVGNIPKIIAKLFSFLPDWCLAMIGLSFAALVILIIYKLVRG